METIPTTSRSLDRYYHINGDTFERQYKEVLSGYREWSELSHAEDWLVFPENIGESICIDETAPSNGELYTIVSNRSSRGGKGTIIAIVKGVADITSPLSTRKWFASVKKIPLPYKLFFACPPDKAGHIPFLLSAARPHRHCRPV